MKHKKFGNFSVGGSEDSVCIDYARVKKAFTICSALDNKLHQRILSFFEEKEVFTEKEIAYKIRLELDVIQEHLRILVRTKILHVEWRDNKKCYFKNEERLAAIQKLYLELND